MHGSQARIMVTVSSIPHRFYGCIIVVHSWDVVQLCAVVIPIEGYYTVSVLSFANSVAHVFLLYCIMLWLLSCRAVVFSLVVSGQTSVCN